MHTPRGSNNRVNEANTNRNTGNRLFDSQNNDQGGYNVGDATSTPATSSAEQYQMKYFETSILRVEWTGSRDGPTEIGDSKQLVLQYMCESFNTAYGPLTSLRDGTTTTQSTTGNAADVTVGRHELAAYFTDCQTRERNRGLFIADQTLNGNTAEFTRQNENGDDSGLECPEERDYYPYWHPSPWRDVAVLTTDTSRCSYYQAQSENVVGRFLCSNPAFNNAAACTGAGGTWTQRASHGLAAPSCSEYPTVGNGPMNNGQVNTFDWTIPTIPGNTGAGTACVLRMRFNISSGDYDGWTTTAASNGAANTPVSDVPTVNAGDSSSPAVLKLATNTDQYGRTFQDRSHVFRVVPLSAAPAPSLPPVGGKIYNLGVRGRRGNIVEVYPALQYAFTPSQLSIRTIDRVHIQWTGSLTTPDGAGSGASSTDRSNIVCVASSSSLLPLAFNDPLCNMFSSLTIKEGMATAGFSPPTSVDPELDTSNASYNGGILQIGGGSTGSYNYMCTRNMSFGNRSQRGTITVTN